MEDNGTFAILYPWMGELGLKPGQTLVYMVVYGYCKATGACYASSRTIGNMTGIKRENVLRILKRLTELGHLKKFKKEENGIKRVHYEVMTERHKEGMTKHHNHMTEHHNIYDESSHDNIIDNIDKNKKKSKKEKEGKNIPQDKDFDYMWKVLGRGDRDRARAEWEMLSEQERTKAKRHITHYVDENKDYCVTLERYLHNRQYETLVYYNKTGGVRHDPDAPEIDYKLEYHPSGGVYRSADGRYCYDGVFTSTSDIRDGLQPNQRPDGQKVYITNNPWIHVEWSAKEAKWQIVNDK